MDDRQRNKMFSIVYATIARVKQSFGSYLVDSFINGLSMSYLMPTRIRQLILFLWSGGKVHGPIYGHCYLESRKINLGAGSYVNRNCMLCNKAEQIEIGSHCAIAYGVSIHTTNHDYGNPDKRSGTVQGRKVIIGDGTWIGADAIILPGAEIGSGCVIAAGSIVLAGKYESNCLYGGQPARLIRELNDPDKR